MPAAVPRRDWGARRFRCTDEQTRTTSPATSRTASVLFTATRSATACWPGATSGSRHLPTVSPPPTATTTVTVTVKLVLFAYPLFATLASVEGKWKYHDILMHANYYLRVWRRSESFRSPWDPLRALWKAVWRHIHPITCEWAWLICIHKYIVVFSFSSTGVFAKITSPNYIFQQQSTSSASRNAKIKGDKIIQWT